MKKLRNLLNYLRDNAIAIDGKFVSIDIAPYEDELLELLEQLQQAHREGWEQAKREADSLLLDLIDVVLESKPVVQSARRAIANMPYKEPRDD